MDWEDEVRLHPDEPVDLPRPADGVKGEDDHKHHEDSNKERCVICLMALRDRTIVGVCGHEFCVSIAGPRRAAKAESSLNVSVSGQISRGGALYALQTWRLFCCTIWTRSHRSKSATFLLMQPMLICQFYLPPLPQRKLPSAALPLGQNRRPYEDPRWGRREKMEMDELDHQVERRREIYQHELYVKVRSSLTLPYLCLPLSTLRPT